MALYDILKVKSIRTSYYKPSSNGECEIFNKSILSILRKLAKDEPKKWSSMVPYAVMAINSRVNDTTSYSAFQLMHGISMLDPLDLQLPYIPDNVTKSKQQIPNVGIIGQTIYSISEILQHKILTKLRKSRNIFMIEQLDLIHLRLEIKYL